MTNRRLPVLATLLIAIALACSESGAGRRTHLVVVTLDTLRVDHVGVYGADPTPTPHLDRLAEEGLVYDAAYTTMPTTGPAHLSLLTGLYPSEHGGRRNGEALRPELRGRDLGARLRESGYTTAAFVSSSLLAAPLVGLDGFDVHDAPPGYLRPGAQTADQALAWLRVQHRQEPARPVFLWMHVYDPHAPYGRAARKHESLPPDGRIYGFGDTQFLGNAERRLQLAADYVAGVRDADQALGTLVEGAREVLEGEILFVVTSDHGESLDEHLESRGYGYDHGEFLDDECVRIPLVLSGAGVSPGRGLEAASIRDLYTTLLAAAGEEDQDAQAEGRVDLRHAPTSERSVAVERRSVGGLERLRLAGELRRLLVTHAVAAANGRDLVILGEDAALTAAPGPDAESLVSVARVRLGAVKGVPAEDLEVDAATREALRQLGYSE